MDNVSYIQYIRRKSNPKSPKNLSKGNRLLGKTENVLMRTDFAGLELELENNNLKKLNGLLEGRNKVLEEHCNLLREKNIYFETRLRDMQTDLNSLRDSAADKEAKSEENSEDCSAENEHNQKVTSLKDRISGAIFGVALPKIGQVVSKIKSKREEMKGFMEEQGVSERPHCPMQKMDFKAKIAAFKVNLFRVVVVIGSLMILSGIGYAGYRVWKTRYRHPAYLIPLDEEEEDSGDEIFRAPGTSRMKEESIAKTNSTDSFETPGISTDFTSILDNANNK